MIRYSQKTNELLAKASLAAKKCCAKYIGSEHILYAMFYINDPVSDFLKSYTSVVHIDEIVTKHLGYDKVEGISFDAKRPLDMAEYIAQSLGFKVLMPLHILYAMLDVNCKNRAAQLLLSLKVNLSQMSSQLKALFLSYQNPYHLVKKQADNNVNQFQVNEATDSDNPLTYLVNLTKKAESGSISPILKREEEIERMLMILSRNGKNNPILIGAPGVGKSAVVEALALYLLDKEKCPKQLNGATIYSLDLTALLAGTEFRGSFEKRIKMVLNFIAEDPNAILFVDEIHMLMGAGASDGGNMDAANILKPMLARSEISLIGATTTDEYKKYIEKDTAFERRFIPIIIKEPSVDVCIEILNGIKKKYEKHHDVTIEDEAIEAAVKLSDRYITTRQLPDKAIDVLDEACANVSLYGQERTFIKSIDKDIENIKISIKLAILRKDFKLQERLESRLLKLEKEKENAELVKNDLRNFDTHVIAKDIKKVISEWIGMPLDDEDKKNDISKSILNLESDLKKMVVGQEVAVKVVANAIKRSKAGLSDPDRPIGSFLFVGPTGVGKTEMAKALAKKLFFSSREIIRFDMSEYMDKVSVSKLVGAAPGYVGYEEGGVLVNAVREKPYSIILFDEIEKAHSDIYNIFLQILDEGRLSDNQGRVANFKNTIIIITSNVGAENLYQIKIARNAGTAELYRKKFNDDIHSKFRPEFLNRLDEIVVFNFLEEAEMAKIANIFIVNIVSMLKAKGINFAIKKQAFRLLLTKVNAIQYGARDLKRVIQKEVVDKISELIISKELNAGKTAIVDSRGSEIFIKVSM